MNYRGAIVDLDGTVYRGGTVIDGAREAVAQLRERGIDLLFLTNNPTHTRDAYVERLARLGIEVDREEVLSAGTVTTEYLRGNHAAEDVYLIGSPGLREQFDEGGLRVIEEPERADVLVTSHDYGFDYEDLTAGLWALDRADTFLGTDPDLTYPGEDGRYPGSGAITGAVARVAEREPDHVLGKPSTETLDIALSHLGHAPEECIVVGDTPATDIALGERGGMTTALVLTGTTGRDELPVSPAPDLVADSLAALVDSLR